MDKSCWFVVSCSLPSLWLQDVLLVLGIWDQTSLMRASLVSHVASKENSSEKSKLKLKREREIKGTRRIIHGKEKIE